MAMTIRLSPDQEQQLEELARAHHTSKAAVLKQALAEKYDRESHRDRVRQAATFFQDRDRELLRRLGEA